MKEQGEAPASAKGEAVKGDALDLPYADGTFDCVVASEILEHVPADDRAISELVRVLKPGGALAITVPRWLPGANLLGAVGRVPRQRGRAHPHLPRRRPAQRRCSHTVSS